MHHDSCIRKGHLEETAIRINLVFRDNSEFNLIMKQTPVKTDPPSLLTGLSVSHLLLKIHENGSSVWVQDSVNWNSFRGLFNLNRSYNGELEVLNQLF